MADIVKFTTLSKIALDLGQIFFASVFLGPLISGEEQIIMSMIGFILATMFWYLALLLASD